MRRGLIKTGNKKPHLNPNTVISNPITHSLFNVPIFHFPVSRSPFPVLLQPLAGPISRDNMPLKCVLK